MANRHAHRWSVLTILTVTACGLLAAGSIWAAAQVGIVTNQAVRAGVKLNTALTTDDGVAAQAAAADFQNTLSRAQQTLHYVRLSEHIPVMKENYQAADNLLTAGQQATGAISELLPMVIALRQQDTGYTSLRDLSPGEYASLLQIFQAAHPNILRAVILLGDAQHALQSTPRQFVVPPLQRATEQLTTLLGTATDTLRALQPLIAQSPTLLGLSAPRQYLLVMQNNDELRPTGGFIGLYGRVTIDRGQITELFTDDSYALDRAAEGKLQVEPPAPLQEYAAASGWFFRDANWSPDFPTSAAQLLDFYHREGGVGDPQGIIAFDPTVIEDLFTLTGPLTVAGTTFTADNFSDELEHEVEQRYQTRGIDRRDRKDIVGLVADEFRTALENLPRYRWPEVATILHTALTEKHILLYDRDPQIQATWTSLGWAGALAPAEPTSDYLMVVDANMVALKSDRAVDRKIDYTVQPMTDGGARATVRITYRHRARVADYRTRSLRDYVRVYVPLGSTLVGWSGSETNDRGENPGEPQAPTVSEELGRTVFGAFVFLPLRDTRTLTLEYQLPPAVAATVQPDHYALRVQKQPGTAGHPLDVHVQFPSAPVSASTNLTIDRFFTF